MAMSATRTASGMVPDCCCYCQKNTRVDNKREKVNQMAAFPKQASFLGSVAALTAVGNSFSLGIKGVCDGVGCSK